MRNPLIKRIPRELKKDAGKYLVIFLFMILLISLVSGFIAVDVSMKKSYDDGFIKYNLEYGHLAFNIKPSDEILKEIEDKAGVKFYDLEYTDETVSENETTLRVYKDRTEVNLEDLMSGEFPQTDSEIALDRMYAVNNDIEVGDTITVNNKEYIVSGFIAVPDYSSLFKDNADMMFDSVGFGVSVVTEEGYSRLEGMHTVYNYAWLYNNSPANKSEENTLSEDFTDDLKDIIKAYDTAIIQAQVDDIYEESTRLQNDLEDELNDAKDVLEEKFETASEEIAEDIKKDLSTEEILNCIVDKAGMTKEGLVKELVKKAAFDDMKQAMYDSYTVSADDMTKLGVYAKIAGVNEDKLMDQVLSVCNIEEDDLGEVLIDYYAAKKNTTKEGLLAKKLGSSEESLIKLNDSLDELESKMDDVKADTEPIVVDLDEISDSENYDNEMSFSLDPLVDLVDKLDATGLYDTKQIRKTIDGLNALLDSEIDTSEVLTIDKYVPRYENKAINFTGDDMGSDKIMFTLFDYIVTVVIAFVFAVTISNTISKEAGVIGTLRASGYTKGELIRHYMAVPIAVTLVAAIVGNILGYTVLKQFFVDMYYGSYSLASFKMLWSGEAFVTTTVVPIAIMFVVNLTVLANKLRLSPLKFLRHDLKKNSKKKAVRLNTKLPIMLRFRIRIIFQNLSNYFTLALGIILAGFVVIFGIMFVPLLDNYSELVSKSMFAKYQYILADQVETDIESAEKYCVNSLESTDERYMVDEIAVYGIEKNSKYIDAEIAKGKVIISNSMKEKFSIKAGDSITLKEKYSDKTYDFVVDDSFDYNASLAIFMNREDYITTFDEEEDYYTGYLTNELLTDISEEDIYTIITEDDMTKVANQLKTSMGSFMGLFKYFGVIMFLALMYLLSKQIIEKNANSIAMTKILGFKNSEIGGLYIIASSVAVIISLLITIPAVYVGLWLAFKYFLYTRMTGYLPYTISISCYIEMIIMGILSYGAVAGIQLIKISKIPKSDALKNVE